MDETTRALLLRSDSATEWGCPKDFDYQIALDEVRGFAQDALQTLQLDFELDDEMQDASFFARLYDESGYGSPLGVRFSTFGRLALPFSENVRGYTSEDVPSELTDLLRDHNYVMVRPEDVSDMYDGLKKELRGKVSWFGRFFDYL